MPSSCCNVFLKCHWERVCTAVAGEWIRCCYWMTQRQSVWMSVTLHGGSTQVFYGIQEGQQTHHFCENWHHFCENWLHCCWYWSHYHHHLTFHCHRLLFRPMQIVPVYGHQINWRNRLCWVCILDFLLKYLHLKGWSFLWACLLGDLPSFLWVILPCC